ncbi:MAG TPA: transporter [Phycisphaerales bacterium]|nr:transporter [Phycisphaerales bacterium]
MSVLSPAPALLLVFALICIRPAAGAPITFNTALPVTQGVFIAREQLVVNQAGDDPSGADRDRTEVAAVSVLGYGVTGRWALFGELPYRDIDLDLTAGGQRVSRGTSGFGDLSLFARYTAYQYDRPQRTFRVAPFGGVKAPTGKDDERDAQGRLPAAVQAGSGSWDYFGGVVMSYQTLRYQFDGQLAYRANTEANGFEAGDVFRLDGSLQYRLYPWRLGGGAPAFVYGVIEANLVHQDKDRLAGSNDPDSGGTRLFLTPGIQYVGRRWILEGAVQVPVVQDLNGTALENDYIVRAGVRFNF